MFVMVNVCNKEGVKEVQFIIDGLELGKIVVNVGGVQCVEVDLVLFFVFKMANQGIFYLLVIGVVEFLVDSVVIKFVLFLQVVGEVFRKRFCQVDILVQFCFVDGIQRDLGDVGRFVEEGMKVVLFIGIVLVGVYEVEDDVGVG